jgi:hypothetical protein
MSAKRRKVKMPAEEAAARPEELPYFVGTPATFQNTTDLLFVLDSGEKLPVHSSQLTAHSHVLSDM